MSRRVLVAPAHLRAIESVYAPILRDAGYTIEFSPHNKPGTEQQLTPAERKTAPPKAYHKEL